eukprot:TRINITY_DN11374_c0_g1_i1.p1 TRINITY_DN11374_c0_g1~~TRINITY_DN11374_c0_g1_i1.p1  ORF type:complete len:253 (+),score=15.46 TRINITY_DN11374_c0_g1_i1:159-917(+)
MDEYEEYMEVELERPLELGHWEGDLGGWHPGLEPHSLNAISPASCTGFCEMQSTHGCLQPSNQNQQNSVGDYLTEQPVRIPSIRILGVSEQEMLNHGPVASLQAPAAPVSREGASNKRCTEHLHRRVTGSDSAVANGGGHWESAQSPVPILRNTQFAGLKYDDDDGTRRRTSYEHDNSFDSPVRSRSFRSNFIFNPDYYDDHSPVLPARHVSRAREDDESLPSKEKKRVSWAEMNDADTRPAKRGRYSMSSM